MTHGSIRPGNIVAADGQIKLTTDSVRKMPAAEADIRRAVAADLRDLAETVTELLTGKRAATTAQLPSPFSELVLASLGTNEVPSPTAAQLLRVLRGEQITAAEASCPKAAGTARNYRQPAPAFVDPKPAVLPDPRPSRRRAALLALAGVLVVVAAVAAFCPKGDQERARSLTPVVAEKSEPVESRPSPLSEQRPVEAPKPQATGVRKWAVVAAIYKDYDAAARRAEQLGERWKGRKLIVHPPPGQGRRYLVVIGSGMERKEAERLRTAARAAGMPRDSYVTLLQF